MPGLYEIVEDGYGEYYVKFTYSVQAVAAIKTLPRRSRYWDSTVRAWHVAHDYVSEAHRLLQLVGYKSVEANRTAEPARGIKHMPSQPMTAEREDVEAWTLRGEPVSIWFSLDGQQECESCGRSIPLDERWSETTWADSEHDPRCRFCRPWAINPKHLATYGPVQAFAGRSIYLAGKVAKNCWREDVVWDLRGAWEVGSFEEAPPWPRLSMAVLNVFDYVGPYFVSCDHGCYHGRTSHGTVGTGGGAICSGWLLASGHDHDPLEEQARDRAFDLCCEAIRRCDVFFAWIDRRDAFATLAEIGYAAALRKQIVIAMPRADPELWFVGRFARCNAGYEPWLLEEKTPRAALQRMIARMADVRLRTSEDERGCDLS